MSILISTTKPSYAHRPVYYKSRQQTYKKRGSSYEHLSSVYVSPTVKITRRIYKKKMVLLLPAHNEEIIIQETIRSAIAAGQKIEDIYVVDDNSSDKTRAKAVEILGRRQVLTVSRSGKALAVHKAIKRFKIEEKYYWLHVADADSVFGKDYFRIYRRALKGKEYVAAVGFVQSLRGNWISKYRVFSYTYGQQVLRRIQAQLGMISVFPGPVTSIRTDVLGKIDFAAESLTEDFDITLQFHRKKLGKIKYIPKAINYTQDPQTLRDFCKQTARWHRGFFQGVRKYKIGTKMQPIDGYIGFQLGETAIYLFQMLVLLPIVILTTHKLSIIPMVFLADYLIICIIGLFAAIASRRYSILTVLPTFYFMRMIELTIFVMAFVEVIFIGRFKSKIVGWQTEGRRYSIDKKALKDTA